MNAAAANGVIRSWILRHVAELAICEDTQRFNALMSLVDEMSSRVEKGGSDTAEDIKAFLHQELPLRIPEHRTAIRRLQEQEHELLGSLGMTQWAKPAAPSESKADWPNFPKTEPEKVEE